MAKAFASGQDGLLASLATLGIQNSTYHSALVRMFLVAFPYGVLRFCSHQLMHLLAILAKTWCRRTSREDGIDYALKHRRPDGSYVQLDALLLPSDDNSASTNVPAQAGYPIITIVRL